MRWKHYIEIIQTTVKLWDIYMVEKLYSVLFEILHAIRIWKNRARKAHLNVFFFFFLSAKAHLNVVEELHRWLTWLPLVQYNYYRWNLKWWIWWNNNLFHSVCYIRVQFFLMTSLSQQLFFWSSNQKTSTTSAGKKLLRVSYFVRTHTYFLIVGKTKCHRARPRSLVMCSFRA